MSDPESSNENQGFMDSMGGDDEHPRVVDLESSNEEQGTMVEPTVSEVEPAELVAQQNAEEADVGPNREISSGDAAQGGEVPPA